MISSTSDTPKSPAPGRDFILDLKKIRQDARENVENGAVTRTYAGDQQTILGMLSTALATEWICVLRYTQHEVAAKGIHAASVAAHFAEHAREEQHHAMQIAERIRQLGGTPSLDPSNMRERSHSEYQECDSLEGMIKENLIAERIAIEAYTEAIKFIGDKDPTTRRLFEEILAKEEEHADEMADLLAGTKH
jgi:bacterioferritin